MTLVSRFRSSQVHAACSHANFEIKRDTSNLIVLVRLLDLKFLCESAAMVVGTSNPPH